MPLMIKVFSVLREQMDRVRSERSKALLAGNDELVSIFDLHLQALGKAENETTIEKSVLDFATTTMSGHSTALDLLDAYNDKIRSASSDGAITIGGTTYQSAQEFWEFKRGEYISDSGAGGFFTRYNQEQNLKLSVANSKNTLDNNDVSKVSKEYDKLSRRSELSDFAVQIDSFKQDTLQTGANFLASSVISNFQNDFDTAKAIAKLDDIKALGVNVENSLSSIIQSAASTKTSSGCKYSFCSTERNCIRAFY